MATSDMDKGQSLLEREERALARKRATLKAAGAALDALRKADQDTRKAFAELRTLGFGQRDLTDGFKLTRAEATLLFPRKGRKDSAADASSTAATHEGSESVKGVAE